MVKFCSNCGAKLKDEETICPNCGETVAEVVTSSNEKVVQPQADTTSSESSVPSPPTKEEKNKLIAIMIVSIIIPIVGLILSIVKYVKKDKKSSVHYLMCFASGLAFGMGGWYWAGFVVGALLIASTIYNGLKLINSGEITLH
ncbi:MAG: zinc-ribbon domain-containing protein [Candidatus Heimdallarchaeaceae archaeon]